MAYEKCQSCNGVGSNYNYSTNVSDDCFSCGGSGRHWRADPTPPTPPVRPGNGNPSPIKAPSNPQKSAQYFMAAIAFFGSAYYVFTNFNDNLIVAGIVGLIAGFIAFKWYKAIIIIAVIAGIIYFVYNDK